MHGRFAPSPTGPLHLGNLRTALLAWLAARQAGSEFTVRMEDLDRVTSSVEHERTQLAELAALGLDWDGPVLRQSGRFDHYHAAIGMLRAAGRIYECFCTRREIAEAAQAPHGVIRRYPGTCRRLTGLRRAAHVASGRVPALRLDCGGVEITIDDRLAGQFKAPADDVVVQRNDGVPAYHIAVVVDDAEQGVEEVVRADDLLAVTPSQVLLQRLLQLPTPAYAHVPLVVGPGGRRLAKRDGAVTLEQLAELGIGAGAVLDRLARSLGIPSDAGAAAALVDRFDWQRIPRAVCPVATLTCATSGL